MKKWLLICVLALADVANAQTPAPATKIAYQKSVPKSVLALMPEGAQSLFWGKFQDGKNAAPKAIHLFALNPKLEFSDDWHRKFDYHFAMDIFQQNQGQLKRINHTPITYAASFWGPVLVRARFCWIDSRCLIPLLNLECFTKNGAVQDVPTGDSVFLSFAEGWR